MSPSPAIRVGSENGLPPVAAIQHACPAVSSCHSQAKTEALAKVDDQSPRVIRGVVFWPCPETFPESALSARHICVYAGQPRLQSTKGHCRQSRESCPKPFGRDWKPEMCNRDVRMNQETQQSQGNTGNQGAVSSHPGKNGRWEPKSSCKPVGAGRKS
jgi:hypothetical protein